MLEPARTELAALLLIQVACAGCPACGSANVTSPPATTQAPAGTELLLSRTSGVAPLAVFFNAAGGDQSSRLLHDPGYVWDFGDAGGGTWETTGRSKNVARGPLAAHVFETPGTYQVTTTITSTKGERVTRTATVTVEDPDVVFAGSKTICFSTGSNFAGCPSGADHQTVSTFAAVLNRAEPGQRLLLKRGDTFAGSQRADLDEAGPGIVGAFGSGEPPAIDVQYDDGLLRLADGRPRIDDWRIMDLHFIGHGSGFLVDAENTIKRITLLRLSATRVGQGLVISTSKPDYYKTPMHQDLALVECNFADFTGGYGAFVSAERLMVLGNRIVNVPGHVFRIQHVNQGVLSQNVLSGPNSNTGHVLKLHAEPVGGEKDGKSRPSHSFVITGNVFEADTNDWAVAIGPQSANWNESVHDGIIDGNLFKAGSGNNVQLHLAGTRLTVRNNIFVLTGAQERTGVHVVRRGVEPPPDAVHVVNNTCYSASIGETATCVSIDHSADNSLVHNNLLVAPQERARRTLDDAGVNTDVGANQALDAAVLVNPSPSEPAGFALSAGSEAIDAGLTTDAVQVDFRYAPRSVDGDGDGSAIPDLGAFEYQGS